MAGRGPAVSVPPRSRGVAEARAELSPFTRQVLLPAQRYIHTEQTSGLVLLAAAVLAMVWANSPWAAAYAALWGTHASITVGPFSISEDLRHWVNDGLMALFFYVVGLEIKRELLHGELSDARRAALPALAALGGMLVPAGLYLALNAGGPGAGGWGIPMATDIAFALGVLALLGPRVPTELKVLLLALAIVDDLGAILVIAVFYTPSVSPAALGAALLLAAIILAMTRVGARLPAVYALLAVLVWVAVFQSGVHATLAGVLLAALTPGRRPLSRSRLAEGAGPLVARLRRAVEQDHDDEAERLLGRAEELARSTEAPLERIERQLHPWSSYVILPLFALANAGLPVSAESAREAASSPVALGVAAGLLLGKPLGIIAAVWIAVRLGLAALPGEVTWSHVAGIAVLAGIGFTVSLFITGLAFEAGAMGEQAKLAILVASTLAGALGYAVLRTSAREDRTTPPARS
jgi:NhaA family Na+:H+ antiporter